MYSRCVPNKLLIAHKSRLLFTYNDDSIRDLTSLGSVSFSEEMNEGVLIGRTLNLNCCTQQANCQSEHIGQWTTPHHLSDVRRGAPSWIWDYLAHSDVTIYVLNAIHAILCTIAG